MNYKVTILLFHPIQFYHQNISYLLVKMQFKFHFCLLHNLFCLHILTNIILHSYYQLLGNQPVISHQNHKKLCFQRPSRPGKGFEFNQSSSEVQKRKYTNQCVHKILLPHLTKKLKILHFNTLLKVINEEKTNKTQKTKQQIKKNNQKLSLFFL